jgi:hypothetical protein
LTENCRRKSQPLLLQPSASWPGIRPPRPAAQRRPHGLVSFCPVPRRWPRLARACWDRVGTIRLPACYGTLAFCLGQHSGPWRQPPAPARALPDSPWPRKNCGPSGSAQQIYTARFRSPSASVSSLPVPPHHHHYFNFVVIYSATPSEHCKRCWTREPPPSQKQTAKSRSVFLTRLVEHVVPIMIAFVLVLIDGVVRAAELGFTLILASYLEF